MTGKIRGSLTVFLSLTMLFFVTFCLVLVEGSRLYYLKARAALAMDLAEFSVLSEYQYELLSHYGVFFLDLDYEQGKEQTAVLEQKVNTYLMKNAPEISTISFFTDDFRRATDHGGLPFFHQAVALMKVKSGYQWIEQLVGSKGIDLGEDVNLGQIIEENSGEVNNLLSGYVDEEGMPLFQISLPKVSFPSIRALTEAVFGSETTLSDKKIDLKERIGRRTLQVGNGEKQDASLGERQWFYAYLFKYFPHYAAKQPEAWNSSLEYQLEYIVCGEDSDRKNLENIMWKIFLLRAGGNYVKFHQEPGRIAQAEAGAAALAGITGNAAIIGLVRELLLISQAIEEGIKETRAIFLGEKIAGIGYEQYLYLFLNTTNTKEKIYRTMDIVELEVREKSGYEKFRMDHCVDLFEGEWTWKIESIFKRVPLSDGGFYENTVKRSFGYET